MFDWMKKSQDPLPDNQEDRQWRIIERVVADAFEEQRTARRWGVFFKLLTFIYLVFFIVALNPNQDFLRKITEGKDGHTAVVKLNGVISEETEANANAIAKGLRAAFEDKKTKAVILAINSPGGSPVQSGYMYNEIKRLRTKYPEIPLYAVISDIGASGGYYVASAADKIYAHESSLVGSIGVTSAGFGFVGTIDKLGVERRNFTSGEHKSFLDPFQPLREDEKDFWQDVLDSTHQQFIRKVKEGRGDRLKNDPDLFSGLVWNGEQAKELGLVDDFASAGQVARDIVGCEDIVDYTVKPNPLDAFSRQLGSGMGASVAREMGLTSIEQLR